MCAQCSDGGSAQENSSLKRVAVVEDFFDIIYAMHVEMGADPGRAPKHAGQKKTYKAVRKRPGASDRSERFLLNQRRDKGHTCVHSQGAPRLRGISLEQSKACYQSIFSSLDFFTSFGYYIIF